MKIDGKSYFSSKKNEKKNEKICLVKKVKSVTNQEISKKQFQLSNNLSIIESAKNEFNEINVSNYHLKKNTPVRKRSSLARPVKVYDSFQPQKWMMMMGNDTSPQDIDHQKIEGQKFLNDDNDDDDDDDDDDHADDNNNNNCNDIVNDNLEPNSNRAFIDAQDEDANWPIRLRLEELLEQSKKKKRKGIVTIRKSKIIKADPGKNSFKDTERLLKVLSNHVDQDSRYNVKRCCVM
ncbi:spindle assembly checkpoint component MAD1-like [Leptopilina heterotoma]|uniref:spindle assembly checkpoint component MAD1-like n=1 Tax=Leptopilina heterotoma TaxID=63436 RepID=UPI001CA7E967|nr:spindle assembly checkpoint component MAD1-like [Leptopilina heterotoma]